MPVLLAGAAAAAFGFADFLCGTAARRTPSAVVALLAQLAGLVLALLLVLTVLTAPALPTALSWGALAGLAGGVGVPLLYAGLARGPMNVVAPLAALTSAAIPVLAGAMFGERPSVAAWVGIVLAVLAGVVVGGGAGSDGSGAGSPSGRGMLGGAALALFAGLCFGGFFVLIARADPLAGIWPVAVAKVSGSLVAAVALLVAFRSGDLARAAGPGWRLAVLGGALDVGANAVFLLAAQRGQLAIVGSVVALYPAATVTLARALHREPIRPAQRVGLALALPALALVGAG